MSIPLLRRLLMKEAVKDTAGSSGIMSINKNIAAKVEQQVQRYVNDAMRQGVDLDTLSPEQLKMIVQMNKPKPPRVIAGDSPEGRGITEALLGKRGEIIDFPQKRSFKQEVDDMIKDGTITKGARGMKKSKKVQDREMFQGANKRLKTEAQLKAEMEASNKKAVKNLGNKRQLTEDEYQDFLDEVGGADQLEAYDFDGTVGSANKIKKQQADYMAEMQMEYRKGKLDPEPGSRTPQRKRFLQSKLDEAEASGDARLLSREEREELFDLDDIEDFAGGGRAGFKGGGLTPEDYLKVKDMLNHWHDYKKGGGTLSKTKFANAFFRENNADGGVAGLLGERTGFQGGGASYKSSSKSSKSKSKSSTSKGPAGGASAGGNYGGNVNPNQTYAGRTLSQRPSNYGGTGPSTTSGGGGGPPGTNTGGGTTTTPTTTPPSFRELIRQKQILDYLNSLEEEDLALGIGPAPKVLGTIFKEGVKGVKPKIGKKGLGLEYLKEMDPYGNSLKFNLGTEYKDLLKGKLKPKLELKGTKGDLEYGFGMDKDKNINFGIKMPFGKQPRVAPRNFKNRLAPDISKFNFEDLTGIPSQAPTNMQLAMITDTQKDIIDKQGKMGQLTGAFDPNATFNAAKMFDDKGSSGVFGIGAREAEPMTREEFDAYINEKGYADGGPARQNFKMGKRAFLKAMFGAGAGIAGLKSGLFGIGGKEATKKAVTETVKQSAGSGTPPPYFFKLVEKIKTMGDDVTEKAATKDREVVTKYKDFELTEDVATGEKTIQRIKTDTDAMYYDETLAEDVYMNYKPGKGQADETTKGIPADEYVEDTSYLRTSGPQKGDIYDTVDGVPDDVIKEGTMFEDNMTEFGKTKKASGGIARMLGE
jgi:hypothetical protein